jgi:hypothetical protein
MAGKHDEIKRGATGTVKGDPRPPHGRKGEGGAVRGDRRTGADGSARSHSAADALAQKAWKTTYENRHNGKGKH